MRFLSVLLCFMAAPAWACLEPPLPTSPSGPTWTETFERRSSSGTLFWSAKATAWRHQCPDREPLLLMTFEPVEDTPFVCSTSFDVVQGGVQYSNFRLVTDPANRFSSVCGDLLVKSTFAVLQSDLDPRWNDTSPFTLFWYSNLFLEVGAYQPSDYGEEDGSISLHGSLSGSWFDVERDGEGFVLEFGENPDGLVAVLYWFTHREGVPYWLIGIAPYERGQTTITFDLLEFAGTGFGAEFDSDEVEASDFGGISLEFDSCTTGVAAWETLGGEVGSFNLRRITSGLHGADCERPANP